MNNKIQNKDEVIKKLLEMTYEEINRFLIFLQTSGEAFEIFGTDRQA